MKTIFPFDTCFAFAVMTVNIQAFNLGIARNSHFFFHDVFIQTSLSRVEDYRNIKICCGYGELLLRPVNLNCTFRNSTQQWTKSGLSYLRNLRLQAIWLTSELSTLKLFHVWWCHKTAFKRDKSPHSSRKIPPPKADSPL